MRTDTTVRDVMHREFLGVSESDSLADAADLLVDEGAGSLVVVRGGEPVGRLDCQRALGALLDADDWALGDEGPTVGSVMGRPLPTVSPEDSLAAVEERLVSEGVDIVVAVEAGEAVGVVTAGDALAAGAPRTGDGPHEPLDGETLGGARRNDQGLVDSDGGVDPASETATADAATAQGVCESCGALVPDLVNANGQAVCPECREV
jgi:CBS domain-containing protein